jgi:hypothetical protein
MPGAAGLLMLSVAVGGYAAVLVLLARARRRLPRGVMPVRQKWTSKLAPMDRDLWLSTWLYMATVLLAGVGWFGWTIGGDGLLRAEVLGPLGFAAFTIGAIAYSLEDQIRLLRRQAGRIGP